MSVKNFFYFLPNLSGKPVVGSSFLSPSLWCCFQALNCCNARICIPTSGASVWNHILHSQLRCPLARTFCIITRSRWIVNIFLWNFFFFQKNVYNLSDSAIKSGISLVLRLGYVTTLIKLCKGQNWSYFLINFHLNCLIF